MTILAIDTSSEFLSLALAGDRPYPNANEPGLASKNINNQAYSKLIKAGNKQSELILPAIKGLLNNAKADLPSINLIAYNQGPGSFTGLRIGLSCALGLAYSLGCRLLPVPAFALYVNEHTNSSEFVIVTLDARLNQIYVAGIRSTDLSYIIEPQLIYPEGMTKLVDNIAEINPTNTVFTGNGYTVYSEKLGPAITTNYQHVEQEYPNALNMLFIATRNIFTTVSTFDAELLYLRNKVALDINEQKRSNQS